MAEAELLGERIRLRSFRPEDVDDVFAYASDPEVTRLAGWEPHRSPLDSMAYIQRCRDEQWGPITFAVEHRDDHRVVGVVDIRIISRLWGIGEIGYTLARQYWGHGLNVEAGRLLLSYGFEHLRLRRIRAMCDADNQRSIRTMEKLGMSREGYVTQDVGARPVRRVVYSLVRRDWNRQARPASLCSS
ncbi:MAG TPA: GNAT family protein [Terriglobales bacterium]|nr:GNAT family protein [Terriglobales bacterium]